MDEEVVNEVDDGSWCTHRRRERGK